MNDHDKSNTAPHRMAVFDGKRAALLDEAWGKFFRHLKTGDPGASDKFDELVRRTSRKTGHLTLVDQ